LPKAWSEDPVTMSDETNTVQGNGKLAAADLAFLESDEARPARLLLEFLRADVQLRKAGIRATVVVFGSSRVADPGASPNRGRAGARAGYGHYYEQARQLASALDQLCGTAVCNDYVIVTGGGSGIMEAANRGAAELGQPTVGLNIHLPKPQPPNAYLDPDLTFEFQYFALRKMHFMLRARALVVFPGGFGTLDELFEALTLVQTGKIPRIPIVLVGASYWRRIVDWDFMVDEGLIGAADRSLMQIVDSAQEAARLIAAAPELLRQVPMPPGNSP